MKQNTPISGAPISSGRGNVSTTRTLSSSPVTPPLVSNDFGGANSTINPLSSRAKFLTGLQQLFGFRKKNQRKAASKDNLEFVKVDSLSDMRIAQGKAGKTFNTKLVGKLESLFDSWLTETNDSYRTLLDREKRLAELEFCINNDVFVGTASDLYADEATQLDVQGKLIEIECSDIRMKEEMEDLLMQWGITQNRLRSVAYNLASFGDSFWSNKVTTQGIVRINNIGVHEVKERLEFNPIQVQTELNLQRGYVSSINRNEKLKSLFDTIEGEENEEFADLFDTRLFGFAINDDMVVPPWSITHFRLNPDQSEYFPMGRSFFLKALAPFRQYNATVVLQSLARVMGFPVTVYTVKTTPGMDENQQFDKINEVREQYEAIGDSGAGTEAYSVNTKIWAPEGLLTLQMLTPQTDIDATADLEMYQDRVAIASGVPKGYIFPERFGAFGNSAISLVEQFKPFARRVFTVQSAILEGITNLFRLHFAITGKYDYRSDFVLSMKFPNEESSDSRMAAKDSSLNLSKNVLDTIAGIVGAIDDPLPSEVIQDILSKFSFLDSKDIKNWVKRNPNKKEPEEEEPEEFGSEGSGIGSRGLGVEASSEGGGAVGAEGEMGDIGEVKGEEELPGEKTETPETGIDAAPIPKDFDNALQAENPEKVNKREYYVSMEKNLRFQERQKTILKRYREAQEIISEKIIKMYSRIDECTINNRHYKFSRVEPCMVPMYRLFQKKENRSQDTGVLTLQEVVQESSPDIKLQQLKGKSLNWNSIKKTLDAFENPSEDQEEYEGQEDDQKRTQNMLDIIS